MCGIVGYVGRDVDGKALDVVLEGLARLEYRGYDSAGVAFVTDGVISSAKKAGKLANLRAELETSPLPPSATAIGHTRWATHGAPTDENAHPHLGGKEGKLALIHNGIIENFHSLKAELLEEGVEFASETDTEVAAHLLARAYENTRNLTAAMQQVVNRLEGAFTLLAEHADVPGVIVAARRNSPLVIGLGEGENFLGSDVAAFVGHTKLAMEVDQDQIVTITPEKVEVIDFTGQPAEGKRFEVTWDAAQAEKGGYDSYMLKEIEEQPRAIADTLRGRTDEHGALTLDEMHVAAEKLAAVDRVVIVACGTAFYSGLTAKYAIEHWTRIPVAVELAHEFRYSEPIIDEHTLVVSISQSGETMDTLMAVKHARELGALTVSICNTYGATIPRESDAALYTHAGPEVAVASTKAFTSQIAACYLLGLYLAQERGHGESVKKVMRELEEIPAKISEVLADMDRVREIARFMADTRSVLFLGRNVGYPIALEGALKLKEIAYIHAEGFAAGELKHGPIALIEPGQPVFIVVPSPSTPHNLHDKVVSNIQEIRARGARTLVIAEAGDEAVAPFADEIIRVPATSPLLSPMLTILPLQVFACELATSKGLDVDQPRNLAKSVTVE
ncbi:glutamine--fructose-6-phosphate transaminase (isomerizing) [Dermatophilus congolensis]|uniref:Glutamine--fructose-6-phosphate aminotransferase [isomerizing] n=1 Tax=Dermatophilus congolensis TaxID=1863 RepID=A0A239VRL6_9MICO|nr:glutamine--fructose-6-phosphate transaminase (isomerizing) [Dermatophilus congolensis]MBO3129846.1 glutamine--fructose-6-phosphate transaminase (isomerizing) [Dermatophilus congolensis]MBO3131526.1 glutamine--fructose-6-phosphate transaminase (isomerizing) [Dermatophilus congolensis]MBO3134321.1 glutamine--fructose-6-phosphate transaminase (isomerizing) [Dermatophilus congolensis]MBO3136555.1 glutamine--fructose-6-phosphate transaminase (isomerizing) [Dermatophilus congolensis]MBO3138799.1 